MTRKPTTKSPEERKLRAEIRALLQVHLADHSRNNTDHVVRELLNLIDDEVRRTRMSMAPVFDTATHAVANRSVQHIIDTTPKAWKKWAAKTNPFTCGGK